MISLYPVASNRYRRQLERDPALKQPAGSPHAGNLLMPYGWGVVRTRITCKQTETTNIAAMLDLQR